MLHTLRHQVQVTPAKYPDASAHNEPDKLTERGSETPPVSRMRLLAREIRQRLRHQHQAGREHKREPQTAAKTEEHHEANICSVETERQPDGEMLCLRISSPEQATHK